MTSTAREAIIEQIVTLASQVSGLGAFRSRAAAIDRSEGPSVVVQPEEEVSENRAVAIDVTHHKLTTLLTFLIRSDTPDETADPLIQAAHALIMRDPTLGGLCAKIVLLSTKWAFESADLEATAIEVRYLVHYQTRSADLASLQ